MKKFIYSAIAAIGLLLAPACSDENEVLNSSGNEALVSFNVNLADGIQTKTISDGKTVNTLHVRVFENESSGAVGQHITGLDQEVSITTPTTSVNLVLVKGKTYRILFWAQYEGSDWTSPYTLGDDGTVSIDYSINSTISPRSNDERYDAFVATETKAITTNTSFDVTLTRPFAQLNFLTTAADIQKAAAGNIIHDGGNFSTASSLKSKVTINNVATTLNPFTKKVSGPESVTFEANATPFTITHTGNTYKESNFIVDQVGTGNTVSITPSSTGVNTTYYYLATNYFLVNTGGDEDVRANLTSATLAIDGSDYKPLEIPNIPVQQNYRTNIYGDLLTAGGTFNVDINNEFSGNINEEQSNTNVTPDPKPVTTASVGTFADLKTQLDNSNISTINLTADIVLEENLTIKKDVTIDGGETYKYGFPKSGQKAITIAPTANVTFKNISFADGAGTYSLSATNYAGTLNITNCDFYVEGDHAAYGSINLGVDNGADITIDGNIFKFASLIRVAAKTTGQYLNIIGSENCTATVKVVNNDFQDGSNLGEMSGEEEVIGSTSKILTLKNLSANKTTIGNNKFVDTYNRISILFYDKSNLTTENFLTTFKLENTEKLVSNISDSE